MGRTLSPSRSEVDLDISGALFADSHASHGDEPRKADEDDLLGGMLDEDHDEDEAFITKELSASNRKASNVKGKSVKKGGAFHSLGLNANLLKAIARKGFSVPTPIQRKTIPLLLQEKDVVGMARTGSGKTAAFVIPMIEKLKMHSARVGARGLILSPARELALQTLQVVKELGRGTDLKCVLLVGGDSLEEQFAAMASNPDIIIATPGRFLHLKVEMQLDLSSIRYVVFDEADRLFEMGFASQLTEILHALPGSRQTTLFSATLPKSLVEFARAGLQEPALVRLDAESKISPDLQNAFFTVKSAEKEAALLHLLQDVIKMPMGTNSGDQGANPKVHTGKRKRDAADPDAIKGAPSPFSTILFVATKHHVEYLAQLLQLAGFAVSYVYSSLDQIARKEQVHAFRAGQTNILVATDIGARGIDIPILANVVNYDFPSQPKVFIHRVGRTARAGQRGWSYSLVSDIDAPYLLDLQLFLARKLVIGRADGETSNFTSDIVVGSLRREQVQNSEEWVNANMSGNSDMAALRSVAVKGGKQYQRSRNSASHESVKRAKALVGSDSWAEPHALFKNDSGDIELERERMLAKIGGFRPVESIFEIGARRGGRKTTDEEIGALRKVRSVFDIKKKGRAFKEAEDEPSAKLTSNDEDMEEASDAMSVQSVDLATASESELEVTFTQAKSSKPHKSKTSQPQAADWFRDTENFMSYNPVEHNMVEDRGFGVHSGDASHNFTQAARGVTMDLGLDDGSKGFGEARGIMRWDKRHKKYVARQNDEDGSKGTRLVRGESGSKIAASFRSGRYDAWRKANRVDRAPRVGEAEGKTNGAPASGKRYRHKQTKAPKAADRLRGDYDKKQKKAKASREQETDQKGRSELRNIEEIRKARTVKEKRREKNARPTKKGKR